MSPEAYVITRKRGFDSITLWKATKSGRTLAIGSESIPPAQGII